MAAVDVKQSQLQVYSGLFSWCPSTLRTRIQESHPGYNEDDPKTWPLITQRHISELDGKEYDGTASLPTKVAYERPIISKFFESRPLMDISLANQDGAVHRMRFKFYAFPFIYDVLGRSKQNNLITVSAYETWRFQVTGNDPKAKTSDAIATGDTVAPSKSQESEEPFNPAALQEPTSPESAYEHILQMLGNQDSTAAQELAEVKHELEKVRAELATQKKRATKAEAETKDVNQRHQKDLITERSRSEAAEENLKAIKKEFDERLATESQRALAAEVGINTVRIQLKKCDEQLAAAQKEAATSNERVMKIWSEMKKTNDAGTLKKAGIGANEESPAGREKRRKIQGG